MTTTKRFVKKLLICGCCGEYFNTWPAYVDQDQDEGYGICKGCQGLYEDHDRKQVEAAFKQIEQGVKPETLKKIRDKFKTDAYEGRKLFVHFALDKGWLKFEIGRS